MNKWVASVNRYDSLNTSTTHLHLKFSFSPKIGKDVNTGLVLYDTFTTIFEINFQANIRGKDLIDNTECIPSVWYSPTYTNIQLLNSEIAAKAFKKIAKANAFSPKQVLQALNACLVKKATDEHLNYWIKEYQSDDSQLIAPIDEDANV